MTEDPQSTPAGVPADEDGLLDRLFPLLSEMDPRDRWLELISAFILAVAVIATAWSGYQATRWGGVMANSYAMAGADRVESTRASTRAGQLTEIDVSSFIAWADAYSLGDEDLTEFYFQRFRPEFRPAVEAWIATEPLENPDAPPTPFDMPEYQLESAQAAEELLASAERLSAEARDANQRGDNYVLTTVLFAAVLFFGGVATKFKSRVVKTAALLVGIGLFVTGAVFLATFPIT